MDNNKAFEKWFAKEIINPTLDFTKIDDPFKTFTKLGWRAACKQKDKIIKKLAQKLSFFILPINCKNTKEEIDSTNDYLITWAEKEVEKDEKKLDKK